MSFYSMIEEERKKLPEYWLDLAEECEKKNEFGRAELALKRAILAEEGIKKTASTLAHGFNPR